MVADPLVASQILTTGPLYLPQKCSEYTAIDPVRTREHSRRQARTARCLLHQQSSQGNSDGAVVR